MTNIARSLGFPIRWMDTKAIDIVHLAAFHKGLEDGMTRDQAIEYAAVEGGIAMNRHQISSNRLHMTGMRQSKNLAVRVASFMSGATSAGYQAITFAVRSRRAALASGDAESIADANARLRRTITALGVQAAMVAGITSLLAKKRGGDDDDDEDREKAAEAYLWSFAEAGTGYLPGSALLAPEALKRIAQLANNSDRVKRYGFRAGRTPISQVVGLYSDLADAGAGMLQAEREGGSKGRQRQDAAEEKLYGAGRRLIDFGAGVNTVKFESMLRSLMGSEEQ